MRLAITFFVMLLSFVEAQAASPIVITHVTVIDVRTGEHRRDMVVLVTDNRITAVEPFARGRHPVPGARVVDGTGKFLIPGLWDMHHHSGSDADTRKLLFPLEIANGVTGARDCWGDCWGNCPDDNLPIDRGTMRWRAGIAAGTLVGPKIVASSPLIDGPRPFWPGAVAIHSVEEARAAVDNAVARRDDFVKVYSFLHRDAYFALAEEAKRKEIVFAGHAPVFLHLTEVSDAGQKSIEHMLDNFSIACSTEEHQLFQQRLSAAEDYEAGVDSDEKRHKFFALTLNRPIPRWLATYDSAKCQSVARHLASNHTWVTPTLVLSRGWAFGRESYKQDDPRLQYVTNDQIHDWSSPDSIILGGRSSEDWKNWHAFFKQQVEAVRVLHEAGVPLLAGTDDGEPYVISGFSLHDELALLVQAGLSPLEALQTATINPAKYLDDEKDYGSVAAGKVADLVLLDADPTVDIHNTTKIRAVVANGRLFTRADLDELLKGVKGAAK